MSNNIKARNAQIEMNVIMSLALASTRRGEIRREANVPEAGTQLVPVLLLTLMTKNTSF